jgi:hypothetical protein
MCVALSSHPIGGCDVEIKLSLIHGQRKICVCVCARARARACMNTHNFSKIFSLKYDSILKVKVKFALEQATKAQRGSKCIPLLFL